MKIHGSTGIPTAKVVKCILSMSTNLCRSDVGCSRFPDVGHSLPLSPLLLPARVTNRSHSTYGSSARSDSHRAVFCPNSVEVVGKINGGDPDMDLNAKCGKL
jgi:hypothetical protein